MMTVQANTARSSARGRGCYSGGPPDRATGPGRAWGAGGGSPRRTYAPAHRRFFAPSGAPADRRAEPSSAADVAWRPRTVPRSERPSFGPHPPPPSPPPPRPPPTPPPPPPPPPPRRPPPPPPPPPRPPPPPPTPPPP